MKKDKKIFLKFILIMMISMALGVIVGYSSMANSQTIGQTVENFQIKIIQLSPILIFVSSLVLILAFVEYNKGKKNVIKALTTQEEEDYKKAEDLLENALTKTMYYTIISFTFFGVMLAGFAGTFDENSFVMVIPAIAIFLVLMLLGAFLQNLIIKQVKLISPEKKGNAFDTKFQEEWFDSWDEAEKALIGQAAYKSYQATSKAILIAFVIFSMLSTISPMGPIPMIVLGFIWFVQYYTYGKACRDNNKNK